MSEVISVFGSSMVPPESKDYQDAIAVGSALAKAGYTVMTGGYGGIMAGASKGANEVGGHVIGVTSAQIEQIRPIPANEWVLEEIPQKKMATRLDYLIREASGYVVMPGGVGTLNELVMAWELMRVREISLRPLVCYGEIWQQTLSAFLDERYIPAAHREMVTMAETPADVVRQIQAHRY
ncbi:MAG: LOG family protein [Chloroflexota bacterium]